MKPSWLKVKNQVLGEKYDLSFSYVESGEMSRLNKLYRKKDYSANVLSFPLSGNEGEILINKKYQKNGGKRAGNNARILPERLGKNNGGSLTSLFTITKIVCFKLYYIRYNT